MFQLGNIPGSLLAFFVADYLGRLRSIQIACLLWILGSAIWITSDGSLGQTLAGRFIAGIGVGFFPVVSALAPHFCFVEIRLIAGAGLPNFLVRNCP